MTDGASEFDGEETTAGGERERPDGVEGAWLAGEVASLVSATVALALALDGSTAVATPIGSTSSLAVGVALLALAAAFAAGKARYRGAHSRALGHFTIAVGAALFASTAGVTVLSLGGASVTGGTVGVVVVVAGAQLVLLDVLR